MTSESRDRFFTILGLLGVAGFLYLYAVKLLGQHGQPASMAFLQKHLGIAGLTIVNILVFLLFVVVLPYRLRPSASSAQGWKSKGVFIGFLIALFTEMFGVPLVIFIFSPLFDYPELVWWTRRTFGSFGMIAGTWLTLLGLLLIVAGWRKIHGAQKLVTGGIYAYIRHPQYVGLFMIILGWLLHWPTLLTLILAPILLVIYYKLARREERELAEVFGDEYDEYARRTPRFFPSFAKQPAALKEN